MPAAAGIIIFVQFLFSTAQMLTTTPLRFLVLSLSDNTVQ
jgi:hypothetical protein